MLCDERLLPVLLGHELDGDEEAEASSPYLLQSADDAAGGRAQQALPAAAEGGLQRLLTSGLEGPSEDEDGTLRLGGEREGDGGGDTGVGEEEAVPAEQGGGALVANADGVGAVVAAGVGEEGQEEDGEGEVVVVNPRVSHGRSLWPAPTTNSLRACFARPLRFSVHVFTPCREN